MAFNIAQHQIYFYLALFVLSYCDGQDCGLIPCLRTLQLSPMLLDDDQIDILIEHRASLVDLTEGCGREKYNWCDSSQAPPPIVTLTQEQERRIEEQYGFLFSDTPPVDIDDDDSSDDYSDYSDYKWRKKRSANNARFICQIKQVYEDVRFAVNSGNELLQMVQVSNRGNQWILSEGCESNTSSWGVGIGCFERYRNITALVINLETLRFELEQIRVACCTANIIN